MALKWIALEYNRHPEIAFWLPNTGSSGQRLRRSRAGTFCEMWRENDWGVPKAPLSSQPWGGIAMVRLRPSAFKKANAQDRGDTSP
jgi:hypothetical protein